MPRRPGQLPGRGASSGAPVHQHVPGWVLGHQAFSHLAVARALGDIAAWGPDHQEPPPGLGPHLEPDVAPLNVDGFAHALRLLRPALGRELRAADGPDARFDAVLVSERAAAVAAGAVERPELPGLLQGHLPFGLQPVDRPGLVLEPVTGLALLLAGGLVQ